MDLYRLKPASARLVRPIEDRLVAAHVGPDAISASAVVIASLGGACLALADRVPSLLLLVPFLAAARLIANILDGSVARRTGLARPIGEMWNELGDRVADVFFIGGLAFNPAVDPRLALGAVVAALLASIVGITSRAAGGRRLYVGVMAKPGRMIVLGIAAPLAFVTGDGRILAAATVVILVGSLVTLVQRLAAARVELGRAG
jgi:phosphatidylglycerophosphate synthase